SAGRAARVLSRRRLRSRLSLAGRHYARNGRRAAAGSRAFASGASRPGAGGPAGPVTPSGASRLSAAGTGPAGRHRPPRIDHLHLAPARFAGSVHGPGLYGVVADVPFVIIRE